ncbi:MAG: microviridin/marinostatin family tricyclic proteinase inhibitor [Pyrinomonadaceae bacterium]
MPDTTDANAPQDSIPQAGTLPFFARFLEGQHGEEDSSLQTAPERRMTLKYPSDRDEIDWHNGDALQAAPEKRMTLKYPSDRDEIDWFNDSTPQASPDKNRSLKYPSDRDEDWDLSRNS